MPSSSVPVPVVNPASLRVEGYKRRDPASYTEEERQQIFVDLVRRMTRLREQRRVEAALKLLDIAAAVSPSTTDAEVEAWTLCNWYWRERDDVGWNEARPAIDEAERLDADVRSRYDFARACFHADPADNYGRTPVDAIRLYWDFPKHYLSLLDDHEGGLEQRVQDLTTELSAARKTAAEMARNAIELLAEAKDLEDALASMRTDDSSSAALLAGEQVAELRQEADRLTAAAQDYRRRADVLLGTLNAIKPGYENPDGTPTPRVVLPLELQRQVHERDGGRCVKCGSTFKLQIDHVVPLSKGGSNEASNLQVLCMSCNTSKGNRYVG